MGPVSPPAEGAILGWLETTMTTYGDRPLPTFILHSCSHHKMVEKTYFASPIMRINRILLEQIFHNYKPPRRFALCRIDADDILGRSSWVMLAITVSGICMKHNSWPTPHPSVSVWSCYRGSRQPMPDRLATLPSNQ